MLETLQKTIQTFLTYAAQYFSALYRASTAFWLTPTPPAGADVLTGAFAFLMIYSARDHLAAGTKPETMEGIVFYGTVVFSCVCGILVIFDPLFGTSRLDNWRKLLSTVCIGSILGCIFISLDQVIPWIGVVYDFANRLQWYSEAEFLVAMGAALMAVIILGVSAIAQLPSRSKYFSVRHIIWSLVIFSLLVLGVHLLVATEYA